MDSAISIWKQVNINRSNRPVLNDHEEILYVKDNIGLYQGKVKITNRQLGRIYLTNLRIIYIDNKDVSMSMALNVENVVKTETIDGFLKRSPKLKIFLNITENEEVGNQTSLDWVCKICSFNNHLSLPVNYKKLPPCVSCGIPPTEKYIKGLQETPESTPQNIQTRDDQCSKCTFINHPSLRYCEMCGSELKSTIPEELAKKLGNQKIENPLRIKLEDPENYSSEERYIKISFRDGGELKFNEILLELIDKIKWKKLMKSGKVNKDSIKINEEEQKVSSFTESGIFKLELLSEQTRKENEMTLTTSLEDLEQLMYKAKDLIKLSNSFNKLIKPIKKYPANIGNFNINKKSNVYHEELSRHLSEYLINFRLTRTSSMITTQDLFADFNRFLILSKGLGYDLVNANDFNKSIEFFEKLNLPIILNVYDTTGLRVLKPKFAENISQLIVQFLNKSETEFNYTKFKSIYYDNFDDQDNYLKNDLDFFKGNTVSEISEEFNWSNNIAIEELDKLINDGLIVIDKSITGTFYFPNKFNQVGEEIDIGQFEKRLEIEENQRLQQEAQQLELATKNFGSEALNQLKGLTF